MGADRSWRPIPGTGEEFWVADDGTVRGPGGDLAPYQNPRRDAWLVNAPRKRRLAQLVMDAFGERPDGPGPWYLVHLDGDKANCRIGNLRWACEAAYRQHRQRQGVDPLRPRIRAHKRAQIVEVLSR